MNRFSKILIFFLSVCCHLNAQVGINTTNPKALLHMEAESPMSPEKTVGMIVPRVSAFSSTNPGADQHSMLVFQNHELTTDHWKNSLYFWDNKKQLWDQILDINSVDVDYNKIIVIGDAFYDSGGNLSNLTDGGGPRYVRFTSIDAPEVSNTLTAIGELRIGKKGNYALALTGGIYKEHIAITDYKCEVLLNGVVASPAISSLVNLAGTQLRSGVFATSQFLTLDAGDRLSLIVTQETASAPAGVAIVNSPFSLVLTLIKEL